MPTVEEDGGWDDDDDDIPQDDDTGEGGVMCVITGAPYRDSFQQERATIQLVHYPPPRGMSLFVTLQMLQTVLRTWH